jgi:hypothetical protein
MNLLGGMVRRVTGSSSEQDPSEDPSKSSIRKALQNRGGVMRKLEAGTSSDAGYPTRAILHTDVMVAVCEEKPWRLLNASGAFVNFQGPSIPIGKVRSVENPEKTPQKPVFVSILQCAWTEGMEPSESTQTSGQEHGQGGISSIGSASSNDLDADADQGDDSQADKQNFKGDDSQADTENLGAARVTQLSSQVQNHAANAKHQIFKAMTQVSNRIHDGIRSLPDVTEIAEQREVVSRAPSYSMNLQFSSSSLLSSSAVHFPSGSVREPVDPEVVIQTPVSVIDLPLAWRSSSSSSSSSACERNQKYPNEGTDECVEPMGERSRKAVAHFSNHIHSHAESARQQIFKAVTKVHTRFAEGAQFGRGSSYSENIKHEQDPASEAHLPGSVVQMPTNSEQLPASASQAPGSSSSSSNERENEDHLASDSEVSDSDCDADSECEDESESKVARLKAVTKDTAVAAVHSIEKLSGLLADNGRISVKGIGRLSELIVDKSRVILTKGDKMMMKRVEEPSTSDSAPKADSSMKSAIRNRGGVMPTQDGFEAFYGIENEEKESNSMCSVKDRLGTVTRQDSLDSPRDGFESFFGYDETPPKKAMPVPRLSLGLGSLEGLKDTINDDNAKPESEVPNFSLDTFRRVY